MVTMVTMVTMSENDLRYACGLNYYSMRLIGIWPEERKWSRPNSYVFLVAVLMMFSFVTAPQTVNIPNIYGDMYMLVDNLSMGNITITISVLKLIAFWINGKPLKSLLKCVARDWRSKTKPSDREAMMSIARTTRKLIWTSTVGAIVVVFAYTVKYYLTAKYTDSKLFFRASFPYDIDVSPNLQLTVCGQFVATMYAAGSYAAVDTFIVMLVLHVCGQLTILKQDVLNLPETGDEKLTIALGKIIRRHEYINAFGATIEGCFNMMLLLQMLGCTLQLCFQGFQAIMSFGGEEKGLMYIQIFFLLLYVLYIMAQLYLYCYVGDKLTVEDVAIDVTRIFYECPESDTCVKFIPCMREESREIANAAYNCAWYNLSSTNAKLLIIIMCRDQLPLRITAGRFCSFTLQLYSEILKRSMGYISVLYTMQHE